MNTWDRLQLETSNSDIMKARVVRQTGYPNMYGAKIPVQLNWNIEKMEELLQDYQDKEVIEGLKYGWPTGRLPTIVETHKTFKNHKGATDHPQALKEYLKKEAAKGVIIGPFQQIPFTEKVGISPLSTRPKKNSQERRVILDLSFPFGQAVNDGMVKDNYLDFIAELTFPRTDDLATRIAHLGKNIFMFKVDLARYFREIPLDPGDYSMIGYIIDGELYFDKVLPTGMRTAPMITQRITNAIRHIHEKMGYFLLNYVDDFLGASEQNKVQQAFQHLTQLLINLGVEAVPDKTIPPTTRIEFLGVTFDSKTMTMEVTQERIGEILGELNTWLVKESATRKEVESLIGKLQFASKCIKPGRTFIARLILWLKNMNRKSRYTIPAEAKKDMAWWGRFLEQYNGISILWLTKIPKIDQLITTDACLKGYGAICGKEYLHGEFPAKLQNSNIAHLEILAVVVDPCGQ